MPQGLGEFHFPPFSLMRERQKLSHGRESIRQPEMTPMGKRSSKSGHLHPPSVEGSSAQDTMQTVRCLTLVRVTLLEK